MVLGNRFADNRLLAGGGVDGGILPDSFHCNWFVVWAVIAFLAIPGNYFTNRLAGAYEGIEDFFSNFLSNGLGNLLSAVFLLICAYWWDRKRKNGGKNESL